MTVDVTKAAKEVAEATEDMVRITVLKADVPTVKTDEDDAFDTFLLEHGGIAPPYDPDTMITIFENSDGLYPNVSAYQTNIDSFGHDFEPLIDPAADDAEDLIFNALFLESAEGGGKPKAPEPDAVEKRLATLRDEIVIEKFRADAFFETCCADESFVELRRRTRMDLETSGNAYWEIIRDKKGRPSQFVHAPTRSMRLTRQQAKFVEVEELVRTSPLKRAPQKRKRRFRRFLQISHSGHGQVVGFGHTYFKEYGDPRVLSMRTGAYFETVEEMRSDDNEGKDAVEANEILHFKIPFPGTAYGVPRWIGNLLAVLGNRQAGEINFSYFDNKTVPPLVLIVSGGRIAQSSKDTIQTFLCEEIKGRQNFHKVMIIEGVPAQAAGAQPANQHDGQMKIDLKPLTDAQQDDALFLKYDERNLDKMGMSFRLPRLLRGDIRDFNRACYDERTETLTLRGWKRLDEFLPDDRIAAYDAAIDAIEFVEPAGLHVYEVDEELLHFRSTVADIMVTEDHRMLARSPTGERFTVHLSQEIPWNRYLLKTTAGRSTIGTERLDFFRLPKADECQIERGHDHSSSVDGDEFLQFLGFWLSEGSLLQTDHPSSPYLVTLSQKEGDVADSIRACLERTGWAFSESRDEATGMVRWCLSNRCLREWLLENCGGGGAEKRLPGVAANLPDKQAAILFDALMDGDGHRDRRPGRTGGFYSSTSKRLCDGVQAIAVQLGLRASVSLHYPASGNRVACWRTNISKGRDARFDAPPERVHYQGRVYCFSVPDHGFFVTRRNGKVAIQGNTANAALEFADTQVFGPERDAFDWIINRRIMIPAGFSLVRFVSRGVQIRDPAIIAEIMEKLSKTGGLVPADVRRLSTMVLGVDLPDIDERWTTRPVILSTSGAGAGTGVVSDPLLSEEEAEEAGDELDAEPAEPKPAKPAEPTEEGNDDRGDSIEEEDRDREGNSQTGAKKRKDSKKRRRRQRSYKTKIGDALVARKLARIHEILLDAERERAAKARAEHEPEPDVALDGIKLEDFDATAEK